MSEIQYLSYSGRKSYITCPKQYEYRYILKDRTRGDPKGSLFGSTIGKIFEWFYSKQAWAADDPLQITLSFIEPALELIFDKEQWNSNSDPAFVTKLRHDLREFIPTTIDIIRSQHLLTAVSRVEVDLTVPYHSEIHGFTLKLGGRADFIHTTKNGVWIIDGKGSSHREKFTDSEQVIWYATQHFLKYHITPVRLGFLYYKFPKDPIQWVAYDAQTIRNSLNQTFEIAKKIQLKQFPSAPTPECHRCNYRTKCDDGTKYVAERRVATGGRINDSVFNLELV